MYIEDLLPSRAGVLWTLDPLNPNCRITGQEQHLSCAVPNATDVTVHVKGTTTVQSCGDVTNTA